LSNKKIARIEKLFADGRKNLRQSQAIVANRLGASAGGVVLGDSGCRFALDKPPGKTQFIVFFWK
jgi:hypothetical protein